MRFFFALLVATVLGRAHEPQWYFLENEHLRLGVDKSSGAAIGWFGPAAPRRNLLNHYDRGRFIQQSFYGAVDGSDWNGKPWRWNPVQGGDWRGAPATLLEWKADARSLYAKTQPKHWATGADVPEMLYEQWIALEGDAAHVRFRATYRGEKKHPRTHQEVPAIFADAALGTLVFYAGKKPWTRDVLTRKRPAWPNEYDQLAEPWAALVDEHDWGLGVFQPAAREITDYTAPGPAGAGGSGCVYFAPLLTAAIEPGFSHETNVWLVCGPLEKIRDAAYRLRGGQRE